MWMLEVISVHRLPVPAGRKYDVTTEGSRKKGTGREERRWFRAFQIQRPGQGPISSMLTCSYVDRREIMMFAHHLKVLGLRCRKKDLY